MIEVRRLPWRSPQNWVWTCAVCHSGYDIPWESTESWLDAMREVQEHIDKHRTTGKHMVWTNVL